MFMKKNIGCLVALSISIAPSGGQARSVSAQKLPGQESNQPFKPFRIIGNIHYVGTNDLACYLITTPAGHILLDTGLEESPAIVRANITALGFKLQDIKIILSSHAHYDHVGGHAEMKRETGAQVYASAGDTEGNTTWTTIAEEKGKKYNVVFAASMSINPGVHMVNYPPWPNIAQVY